MTEPLEFGKHSKEYAQELWEKISGKKSPNPLVRRFGRGPETKTCKDCKRLVPKKYSNGVFVCEFNSSKDHSRFWPACKQYDGPR